MRRSFRTRESEAWHTQGVALGWDALSLWDAGNLPLMPPPPPGMGNEWISQRLEMGHNRSVSGLDRQINDNPEIKGLCSKLPRMLLCED
jgi:hypothetical protein